MSQNAAPGRRSGGTKKRLVDVAYERLSDLIVHELPSGHRLSETDLAASLGMSKTPVREALQRLESEGLVSPIPHVGYLIPHLSYPVIREALEVREAIEGYLAGLAAERIREDDLAELAEAFRLAAERPTERTEELAVLKSLNDALHGTIARVADNHRMNQILVSVRNQVQRAISELVGNDVARYRKSYEEHVAIFEALQAGDPQLCEQRMREHLVSVNQHILRRFR